MAKFLFISKEGSSLPMALRVHKEHHTSSIYIADPLYALRAYENVTGVQKVSKSEMKELAKDKAIVKIFDQPGLGDMGESLLEGGHKVVCSSKLADRLEDDR